MDIDHRNLKGGTYTTRSGIAATQEARPTSDQNGAGGDGSCGHDLGNFEFGCNLLGGGGCTRKKNSPPHGEICRLKEEECSRDTARDTANRESDLETAESFNAGYL